MVHCLLFDLSSQQIEGDSFSKSRHVVTRELELQTLQEEQSAAGSSTNTKRWAHLEAVIGKGASKHAAVGAIVLLRYLPISENHFPRTWVILANDGSSREEHRHFYSSRIPHIHSTRIRPPNSRPITSQIIRFCECTQAVEPPPNRGTSELHR